MAKQTGIFKITGCFDNICFYKMGGEYYARTKSSLTGKRVKQDPVFTRTMEYAGLLAKASKIASMLYKSFPNEKKEKGTYKKLVGRVMQLLKEEKTFEEISLLLLPVTKQATAVTKPVIQAKEQLFSFAEEILRQVFLSSSVKGKLTSHKKRHHLKLFLPI